jgi:hypothetical protein
VLFLYVDFQFFALSFDTLGGFWVSFKRSRDRRCYLTLGYCVWLRAVTQLCFDVLGICKDLCNCLVVCVAFRRVLGSVEFFLLAGKSRGLDLNQTFSSSYSLFAPPRSSFYFVMIVVINASSVSGFFWVVSRLLRCCPEFRCVPSSRPPPRVCASILLVEEGYEVFMIVVSAGCLFLFSFQSFSSANFVITW